MTLPNFLLIGAAKSGTSSLYHYFRQHPQIYMSPNKEPSFFAYEGKAIQLTGPGDQDFHAKRIVTDLIDYQALFGDRTNQPAIGEASILYLYAPDAPARIHHYLPDVKLMAVLRNPVDRAFSSYAHLRRDGRESIADFRLALQEEEARIKANWEHQWHYAQLGFYYTQTETVL